MGYARLSGHTPLGEAQAGFLAREFGVRTDGRGGVILLPPLTCVVCSAADAAGYNVLVYCAFGGGTWSVGLGLITTVEE